MLWRQVVVVVSMVVHKRGGWLVIYDEREAPSPTRIKRKPKPPSSVLAIHDRQDILKAQ